VVIGDLRGAQRPRSKGHLAKPNGLAASIIYTLNHLLEYLYIDNWDLIRLTVNREENGGERSSGFACKRRRISL
jgi:hypothetical protein